MTNANRSDQATDRAAAGHDHPRDFSGATSTIGAVYHRLLARYGTQLPPAIDPLAAMIGVVLAQNTNRTNVEHALENLREAGLLAPGALDRAALEEIEQLIRPAGNARLKAARLRNLVSFLAQRYDGSLAAMGAADLTNLRSELAGIQGIGPETADSILLEALGRPVFVVNRHVHRVFKRHGWIEFEADPEAIREHFESQLDRDPVLWRQWHALLDRVGSEHCRKKPQCEGCPLADLLPEAGPLEPEW